MLSSPVRLSENERTEALHRWRALLAQHEKWQARVTYLAERVDEDFPERATFEDRERASGRKLREQLEDFACWSGGPLYEVLCAVSGDYEEAASNGNSA